MLCAWGWAISNDHAAALDNANSAVSCARQAAALYYSFLLEKLGLSEWLDLGLKEERCSPQQLDPIGGHTGLRFVRGAHQHEQRWMRMCPGMPSVRQDVSADVRWWPHSASWQRTFQTD